MSTLVRSPAIEIKKFPTVYFDEDPILNNIFHADPDTFQKIHMGDLMFYYTNPSTFEGTTTRCGKEDCDSESQYFAYDISAGVPRFLCKSCMERWYTKRKSLFEMKVTPMEVFVILRSKKTEEIFLLPYDRIHNHKSSLLAFSGVCIRNAEPLDPSNDEVGWIDFDLPETFTKLTCY